MKTKTMLGTLIMVALIASSVGVGYAGGGSGGGPGGNPNLALVQCYEVLQGSKPPHILSINDQFTDDTVETVGKLKLVCAPTTWDIFNTNVPPLNTEAAGDGDHLACYEISQAHAASSVVTLNDVFGVPQTVKVQGPSKYVCVAATKVCVSGGCLVHGEQ